MLNKIKKYEHGKHPNSRNGFKKGNTMWENKEHPRGMKGKRAWNKDLIGYNAGEKCNFYIDGRTKLQLKYPIEFYRIRNSKIIHKRDNFTCQLCFSIILKSKREDKNHLILHHIDYNKKNNSLNNLLCLCTSCHGRVNKDRKKWNKHFQSIIETFHEDSDSHYIEK